MFLVIQRKQTFTMNFVFISLCEVFFVVSKYDEMNYNIVFRVFTMYYEV